MRTHNWYTTELGSITKALCWMKLLSLAQEIKHGMVPFARHPWKDKTIVMDWLRIECLSLCQFIVFLIKIWLNFYSFNSDLFKFLIFVMSDRPEQYLGFFKSYFAWSSCSSSYALVELDVGVRVLHSHLPGVGSCSLTWFVPNISAYPH